MQNCISSTATLLYDLPHHHLRKELLLLPSMQVSAIKEIIRRHHHHHAPRNSKNTEKKIPRNRHISAVPFDVDGLLLFSIIHHTVTLLSTLSLLRISIIILSAANTCRSTTLIEIPLM